MRIEDTYKYFVVGINDCKEWLGGVLMQKDYVISYESIKLKGHEKLCITWSQLAAIVHALRIWCHYLMGRGFLLKTDNLSMKCVFEQPNINSR